jgi:hypothetical protein
VTPTPTRTAAADRPRRTPGRPAVADCPEQRRKHLACALLVLTDAFTRAQIADLFEVSIRTVQLWTKKALRYDCPQSEALRGRFGRPGPSAR